MEERLEEKEERERGRFTCQPGRCFKGLCWILVGGPLVGEIDALGTLQGVEDRSPSKGVHFLGLDICMVGTCRSRGGKVEFKGFCDLQ